MFYNVLHILGMIMPTAFHIFQRGGQPPTMQLMFEDVWTYPYCVGELMAEPHDLTVGPVNSPVETTDHGTTILRHKNRDPRNR